MRSVEFYVIIRGFVKPSCSSAGAHPQAGCEGERVKSSILQFIVNGCERWFKRRTASGGRCNRKRQETVRRPQVVERGGQPEAPDLRGPVRTIRCCREEARGRRDEGGQKRAEGRSRHEQTEASWHIRIPALNAITATKILPRAKRGP
jgi:hypothetical protein